MESNKVNNLTEFDLQAEVISFFKTLGVVAILLVLFMGSVVQAYKIPSGSMIPTLEIGDRILVSKLSYGFQFFFSNETLYQYSTPARGDVVVFTRADDKSTVEDESSINLIKRVIGLPGETIEVRSTKVYIDNKELSEPYARYIDAGMTVPDFGPVKIPAGHVIVLGDNRDSSKDSRFWNEPFLPISRIKGRALIIYWSWQNNFFSRIGRVIR